MMKVKLRNYVNLKMGVYHQDGQIKVTRQRHDGY